MRVGVDWLVRVEGGRGRRRGRSGAVHIPGTAVHRQTRRIMPPLQEPRVLLAAVTECARTPPGARVSAGLTARPGAGGRATRGGARRRTRRIPTVARSRGRSRYVWAIAPAMGDRVAR